MTGNCDCCILSCIFIYDLVFVLVGSAAVTNDPKILGGYNNSIFISHLHYISVAVGGLQLFLMSSHSSTQIKGEAPIWIRTKEF